LTQYMLSVHTRGGQPRQAMTEAEPHDTHNPMDRLESEMRSAGAFVFAGRLHEPETATVVRVSDGEVVTTDGPFLESKEQIGGIYIIEADDLDAAMGWARKTSALISMPIEVRPFWDTHTA
jgi:hypothetical protein